MLKEHVTWEQLSHQERRALFLEWSKARREFAKAMKSAREFLSVDEDFISSEDLVGSVRSGTWVSAPAEDEEPLGEVAMISGLFDNINLIGR